jgi:hypothetical protein
MSARGVMPSEIIECMSAGRQPSVDELFRVAKRIRADFEGQRSAFARARPLGEKEAPLLCLRAAHAALCGTD